MHEIFRFIDYEPMPYTFRLLDELLPKSCCPDFANEKRAEHDIDFLRGRAGRKVDDITMQGVGECVAKIHNEAHFIKTELPTIPEYDPTPYIEAKMQKLNQQDPAEDEETDDMEDVGSAIEQSPYLVNVIEGVR